MKGRPKIKGVTLSRNKNTPGNSISANPNSSKAQITFVLVEYRLNIPILLSNHSFQEAALDFLFSSSSAIVRYPLSYASRFIPAILAEKFSWISSSTVG